MNSASRWLFALLWLACAPQAWAERNDRNQPLHLEADRATMDDARQVSIFEGNVRLTQGTLVIRGERVVVTQTSGGFRHGTVTGNLASFRQKMDDSEEYAEGEAERIEYDANSELLELFGRAGMTRGRDEVHGDHITYDSRQSSFVATGKADQQAPSQGRVRAVFQPREKSAEPAKP